MTDIRRDTIKVEAQTGAPQGTLTFKGKHFFCALGTAGLTPYEAAREGDMATPCGSYRLTGGYWRADRISRPQCAIPLARISAQMGWCDAPDNAHYNRPVTLPFADSHEKLWRDDGRYDLLFVLDFNRDPVIAGKGSAIFLHMTDEALSPTHGCIALKPADLIQLAQMMGADQRIDIKMSDAGGNHL